MYGLARSCGAVAAFFETNNRRNDMSNKTQTARVLEDKKQNERKTLRPFTKGERVPRERTVLDENRIKTTFVVGNDKHQYVAENCVFDYSGCSREEIMLLAVRGTCIAFQNRMRNTMNTNLNDAIDARHYVTVDVKADIVDVERTRTSKSPFERAASDIQSGKLTEADKAELRKLLES